MNSRNIHCPDSKENQKWLSHADKYVCLDGFCSLTHILGHLNKGEKKKSETAEEGTPDLNNRDRSMLAHYG